MNDAWATLAAGRYLNLESFKRDGTPVGVPVWQAVGDGCHIGKG